MRNAYLITAHHKPDQLQRLIRALDHGSSSFYLHLDRACNRPEFEARLSRYRNLKFVKSEEGGWGKVGIVKGIVNGLFAILQSREKPDFIHLLSGQDYPLQSHDALDRFLEEHWEGIFIEHFPLPASVWPEGGLDRIQDYHFGDRQSRNWRLFSKCVSELCIRSGIGKRTLPGNIVPFGGSAWWSIPCHAAEAICSFIRKRPEFLRFHRFSLLPDEMFFQTILLNSQDERTRANVVNDNLRFIHWPVSTALHPAVLTVKDFAALTSSGKFFARKLDMAVDAEIFGKIDEFRCIETVARDRRAVPAGRPGMD